MSGRLLLITPRDALEQRVRAALAQADIDVVRFVGFAPAGPSCGATAAWDAADVRHALVDLAWDGADQVAGGELLCRLREADPGEGRAIVALVPREGSAGRMAIDAAADDLLFEPLDAQELRWRLALASRRNQRMAGVLSVRQYASAALERAVEALPVAVVQFQTNAAGQFRLRLAPDALRKLGLDVAPQLGREELEALVADVDRSRVVDGLARAIAARRPWCEACELRDGKGGRVDVRLLVAPHGADEGGVATWSGLVLDLSAQGELEHRVARATAGVRARDAFLRTMSHELRTPLTAILGMSQILRAGAAAGAGEVGEMALETLERAGRELLELVEHVLELAHLSTGDAELPVGPLDLSAAVRAAVARCEPAAAEAGLALETSASVEHRVRVHGEADALSASLEELLRNAIGFTSPGGRVGVELVREGTQRVRCVVRDTGPGLPLGRERSMFEPFVQGDQRLARERGGSGLGLALVHRRVAAQGGAVVLDSDERGASVALSLPAADAPPTAPAAKGARRRLLLADAGSTTLSTHARSLAAAGHTLLVAHDLASLLEQAPRAELALVAAPFGELEPCRVLDELAQVAPALPVALLPTLVCPGDVSAWRDAGAVAVLPPPLTVDELARLLETTAARQRS